MDSIVLAGADERVFDTDAMFVDGFDEAVNSGENASHV